MAGENNPSTSHWCLLVASCDAYSDLWPFFFHFLFKYWPEVPRPIYLVSNFLSFDHPSVVTLKAGKDISWGDTMTKALTPLKESHFLFMLDDFLLSEKVDHTQMEDAVRLASSLGSPYFAMDSTADRGEPIGSKFVIPPPGERPIGLNLTLWQKEFLLQVAEPGLNIWQAERRLKDFGKKDERPYLMLLPDTPALICYVESVKGGFWKPTGHRHLQNHGLKSSPLYRPFPPQGETISKRVTRSFLKRYMAVMSSLRGSLAASSGGWKIRPLEK